MASGYVNSIGMSPDNLLECFPGKYLSFGWLSPRISFSRDLAEEEETVTEKASRKSRVVTDNNADEKESGDSGPGISGGDFVDFEFRLGDLDAMLPADELFSNGKLMPLQISSCRQRLTFAPPSSEVNLAETQKFLCRSKESSTEPYLFSPKAPRCSGRWKEILCLKKLYQNCSAKQENVKSAPAVESDHNNRCSAKSLKQFLLRGTRSSSTINASIDSSSILPFLNDVDNESRLSLSSSHDRDDIPRLSLDSGKLSTIQLNRTISRDRAVKHKPSESTSDTPVKAAALDSPRMNSSGKIVFHGLERSSSSPSSFHGGFRYKYRGMERSYSANVSVTPILNIPVRSLRLSSISGNFNSHQKDNSGRRRKQNTSVSH